MNSLSNKTKLYYGTAGWAYEDWIGPFYPQKQSSDFDFLTYYSNYFNFVEVNVTYYKYISDKIVQGWINKLTADKDFSFSIKANLEFTHKRIYTKDSLKKFSSTLDILNKKGLLAGVLFQFPYSFVFSDQNLDYLKKINDELKNYNQFLEVRHKSWLKKDILSLLKELDITICSIDQPQVGQSLEFEPLITSDKAYFRFHGRNKSAWQDSVRNFGKEQTYAEQSERYNYLYTPGELTLISQKIKEVYDKVKEIYIVMNNHPKGNAVVNALELMKMLDDEIKIEIPETIKNSFPRINDTKQKTNVI